MKINKQKTLEILQISLSTNFINKVRPINTKIIYTGSPQSLNEKFVHISLHLHHYPNKMIHISLTLLQLSSEKYFTSLSTNFTTKVSPIKTKKYLHQQPPILKQRKISSHPSVPMPPINVLLKQKKYLHHQPPIIKRKKKQSTPK